MSRHDWESGSLLIPSAEWAKLKAAVRTAYNAIQDRRYQRAVAIHQQLLAMAKGKRGFDFRAAFHTVWTSFTPPPTRGWMALPQRDPLDEDTRAYDAIENALFPFNRTTPASKRPVAPKKKAFAHVTTTTRVFRGEATISFSDDRARTVRYASGDNNHQVERARACPLSQAFFAALHQVVWTRGSGGELVGNDEYNRGSRDSGGGGNYTTASYGPRGGRPVGKSEAELDRAEIQRYRSARW